MVSVPVKAAATVILLRDAPAGVETLLLRRQGNLAFAGGQWVFPGGRIDDADYQDDKTNLIAAARRAAAREAYEEAGLKLDATGFEYIAHWTTPAAEKNKRRYATWFFAAEFNGSKAVTVDHGEIEEHRWVTPAQALTAQRQKIVEMMPPTFATLTEIAHCATAAEALGVFRQRPVIEILPKMCREPAGRCLLYPGDAGYERADPAIAGPRHRTSISADGWRYERSL